MTLHEKIDVTTIIGLGNLYRGEDAIGIYVAKAINEMFPNIAVYTEDVTPIDEVILEILNKNTIRHVIFIDACNFAGKIGEIRLITNPNEIQTSISSHKIPIQIYFKLLAEAGKNPMVVGIQVSDIRYNNATDEIVERNLFEEVLSKIEHLM